MHLPQESIGRTIITLHLAVHMGMPNIASAQTANARNPVRVAPESGSTANWTSTQFLVWPGWLFSPAWQLNNRYTSGRRFASVGFCHLTDFHQVLAVFNKFTDNGTVDKNGIAIRIVAANLALALAQETVVTHPVGELMRQPGAALWTIVIGTRCAHFQCKRLIPMNTLRTIRHIETVLDTQARMRLLHFPRELVGANIQTTPALRIADETGYGHRTFHQGRQLFAFLDVFPVTRSRATDFFLRVQLAEFGQLFFAVRLNLAAHVGVLRATLTRFVTISTEYPRIRFSNFVAMLVEEIDVVDLLECTAGKLGLMLNQIFQIGFGSDDVIAQHRFVPGPVGAGPHRVHTRQATAITGNQPAGGEQETGQRNDRTVLGFGRVFRIAPQRVVVADAVSVVTDRVTGGFVVPRLDCVGDLDANALAQLGQTLFSYFRKFRSHLYFSPRFSNAGRCHQLDRKSTRLNSSHSQ